MAGSRPELSSSFKANDYYDPDIQTVKEPTRTVLEKYSKIPAEKIVDHVNEVRKRAWAVFPYPCIGGFRFLDLELGTYSMYPEILERVKSGEKFLDLGCGLAQELRLLAYDGAPSENLYGSDLRLDLADTGYDLFNDRESLKSPFIEANILDENSPLIKDFAGQFSFINAMSFFHLFDYETQKIVAKRIVTLLRPQRGSVLMGRHVGQEVPREGDDATMLGYRHNEKSWKEFWEVIGKETGTKWSVEAKGESWGHVVSQGFTRYEGMIKLKFLVRRE